MGAIVKSIPQFKYLVGIILFNVIVAVLVLLLQNNLPPTVPLYYGRPRGEEQLAPQLFLLVPPLSSAVVTIINGVIAYLISDQFVRKVVLGISCAVTILSTITVINIILLVGNI